MNTKLQRIVMLSSCVLLTGAALPFCVFGQSQGSSQQSVAEAARRAKEQKKLAAKPVKVVTEDDLKPAAPQPATQATTPEPAKPAAGATTQQATAPAGPAKTTPEAKESEKQAKEAKIAKLADLKRQLAAAQSDLDLLQRQFSLQRDTFYSNPDYAHDKDGKGKLDALQTQIANKQQAVEELKTKVAALQELLGPDAQTEKPATPPQS